MTKDTPDAVTDGTGIPRRRWEDDAHQQGSEPEKGEEMAEKKIQPKAPAASEEKADSKTAATRVTKHRRVRSRRVRSRRFR